jgi:hypothetical protein
MQYNRYVAQFDFGGESSGSEISDISTIRRLVHIRCLLFDGAIMRLSNIKNNNNALFKSRGYHSGSIIRSGLGLGNLESTAGSTIVMHSARLGPRLPDQGLLHCE